MATSRKTLNDKLRARYMEMVGEYLTEKGEELLVQ